MKDLVSIVIPVYNSEAYLKRCVDSMIDQTYTNLEIILVDDGSTDTSSQMCDALKAQDNRITVIHKENGGLSSARNAGIDIARGEYIVFVDSDDFMDTRAVEKMLAKSHQYNAEIVICNRYYYYEDGKKLLRYKIIDNDLVMDSEEAIYELNSYKNFDMSAHCKLFKRNLFSDIHFPLGKISEDFYIMYLLFDKAEKLVYMSEPLYFYLQRRGSISKRSELYYDFVDAAYAQMIYIEEKYPNLKACVHAAYASANMTIYNIFVKNGGKCPKDDLFKLREAVNENYQYIGTWPLLKRIQAYLFVKCIPLYDIMFKTYRIIKKV